MSLLAPLVGKVVTLAIAELNAAGWDARVFETLRSEELQAWDFEHGVTNAAHAWTSWHGYGLAVDVVSRQHGWDLWGRSTPTAWQDAVVAAFKKYGMAWAGDWTHGVGPGHAVDWDHFQWGKLRKSPSPVSISLFQSAPDGYKAVWPLVGAA
ncbi:MAG: M15 family metallopeptidase [Gemmatimonadaceae bacterium]